MTCRLCDAETDWSMYGVCLRCIQRLINKALDEKA